MGQTVLEINGMRYDATTGSLVSMAPKPGSPTNIDGVSRNPVANPISLTPHPPKTALSALRPSRLMHDVTVSKRPKQQKSQTLMRNVVKKPAHHQHTAPQHTSMASSPAISNQSYISALTADMRLERALHTPKHPTVSRFESPGNFKTEPKLQHLPVAVDHSVAPPVHNPPTLQHSIKHENHNPLTSSEFVDSQLSKVSNSEADSPFKKQKLRKRIKNRFTRNKLLSVGASVASLALIGGFIVYQNLPSISLALASKNAGISMSVPKGIPSNFQMDKSVDSSPGQITVSYKSRNDDREFALTQQVASDTTQESLEESVKQSSRGEYQTYQTNGIKLFIVTAGRADWVDAGVRYSLSGNSGLSSEQLATIASSL